MGLGRGGGCVWGFSERVRGSFVLVSGTAFVVTTDSFSFVSSAIS